MTRPTHTIRSWQQQLGSLSLCSRLTLLLLAVGLTPMVFSQVLAMKAYSDRILNHHLDATEQMASGKLEQLQALLTTKSLELDALAQALQQRPATLERDWAQQASQLGFDDLMLVDLTQRRVIAAALDPGLIGTSLDTEMLHDCGLNKVVAGMGPLNQLSVVPLSRDPCTEGMATWMAVPLQDPGKQNLLLAGRLDAASFRKVVDSRFARLNHDAEAHLVIEQRQGDERQFVAVPTGEAAASRPAVNFQPISRGGLDVADRLQGLGGASYLRAANGELMLGAWRLIPQSNVAVLVTIPEAEPRLDGQALNRQLLMLLAATAVLVTAAGVVLGWRLAGPIQKLHQAIQGFDPADETSLTPVLVSGHDEIATLASTINAMAQRIQERTSNLRETKEQLNAYIQTAQTTLLALDFEGRITLLNRSGCDLIGIPPDGWAGLNWLTDMVDPEDQAILRHWLDQAAGATLPPDGALDYHVVTSHRGTCLMHWHLSLLDGTDGKPIALLGSGEDITCVRAQKLQLEQARQEADRANAAKSEFLSRMSHELRTPMNAIIGLSHLALRTDLDAHQRDYLQKISNAGQGLLVIINDILDFAKIEAGKLHLEAIDFQLDAVLADVATLIADRIFAKGVELLFRVDDDVPTCLNGDPLRLTQVLLNLLSNAAKFTEQGQILLQVGVGEQQQEQVELVIRVQDTGIGMSEAQMSKLFQAFTQAELSTTRRYGGTGLGLSICQRLLELMDGSIAVSSVRGEGSCFTARCRFRLGVGIAPPVLPEALQQMRVLVVDDNPVARDVITQLLHHLPLRCDTAGSGAEALALLHHANALQHPYGLILLDWQLGDQLDGLQVAANIRANPAIQQPKIVLVTAYGAEEACTRAAPGLLDGVLCKPVRSSDLIDQLAELFGTGDGVAVPAASTPGAELAWGLQGLKVLVVEDHPINQQIVSELLTIAGVEVSTASNGVEALAWLTQQPSPPCDLVLMDLNMPEMDGWECTRRLRADARWQHLPVLAMTAHAMRQERDRCLSLGMQDHITKPIDPELLYERLQHWSGRQPQLPGEPAQPVAQAPVSLPSSTGQGSPPQDQRLKGAELASSELTSLELEGFDLPGALKRVAGNRALYRQLLQSLVHTQADAAERLQAALERNNLKEATLILHSLRGVSANLGATALADAATQLEDELHQRCCRADTRQNFETQLQVTMGRIRRAFAMEPLEGAAAPQQVRPAASVLNREQRLLLAQFDSLLVAFDGEALELLNQQREALITALGSVCYELLAAELMRFDFAAARAALHHHTPSMLQA
jgi:two-component system, sensor histidine kinase and response regulator